MGSEMCIRDSIDADLERVETGDVEFETDGDGTARLLRAGGTDRERGAKCRHKEIGASARKRGAAIMDPPSEFGVCPIPDRKRRLVRLTGIARGCKPATSSADEKPQTR